MRLAPIPYALQPLAPTLDKRISVARVDIIFLRLVLIPYSLQPLM